MAAATVPSPVGGPVPTGWREGTLTRAKKLESLCEWVLAKYPRDGCEALKPAIDEHLKAARQAAMAVALDPGRPLRVFRNAALLERAMSNLDGAEAQILNFAAAEYVYGQIPCLLRHVRCHLKPSDPRRQEFERIARRLSVTDVDHPLLQTSPRPDHAAQVKVVEEGGL